MPKMSMSDWTLNYYRGGVHLPALNLWLDPHHAVKDDSLVFVSHAHADHIARHRTIITSKITARFIQARLGKVPVEHALDWQSPLKVMRNGETYLITLFPAGHILGSAMCLIEWAGKRLLYTGDFKLRQGLTSEPCQPVEADILIMETTFGRPIYRFPPTHQVMDEIIRFCLETHSNRETPLLMAYSLGKSQELLKGISKSGLRIYLHKKAYDLTRIYEESGRPFDPYFELKDFNIETPGVIIMPSHGGFPEHLKTLGPVRKAAVSGWSVHSKTRYQYKADIAFTLSDHADFPDLIRLVHLVKPQRVYTLHGFASDFAHSLREEGFDTISLSQPDQLQFIFGAGPNTSEIWSAGARPHRYP